MFCRVGIDPDSLVLPYVNKYVNQVSTLATIT